MRPGDKTQARTRRATSDDIVLSAQVLNEFYVTVT